MNDVTIIQTPYRLGAIELIELGRPAPRPHPGLRRPFLASRGARLGQFDFLADIGSFLAGAFEFLFKTLADIVSVPLDLASQGVGVLFDGLAGFLANIPILGELASQLLLVGKAVIQWGLSVPGLLLEGIGNVFGEVKKAIDATSTPAEAAADEAAAKSKILDKAKEKGGDAFKKVVKDAIEGKAPADTTGTPRPRTDDEIDAIAGAGASDVGTTITGSDLGDKVLTVGLPIAAATTLALLVVS